MNTPNDLPSVGTEDALMQADCHAAVAETILEASPLIVPSLRAKLHTDTAIMLHALVSERDELASRVTELESAGFAAQPGAVGEPTDADWADFGAWAERDKGAMDMLGKLIDVWDDGQLPHEHRCYIDGAWSELIAEARALIAAAPTEAKPAQDALDAELLDWLVANTKRDTTICAPGNHGGKSGNWLMSVETGERDKFGLIFDEYEGPTLRDAIRAAISAKKGGAA